MHKIQYPSPNPSIITHGPFNTILSYLDINIRLIGPILSIQGWGIPLRNMKCYIVAIKE